jgi:hypothetical protein
VSKLAFPRAEVSFQTARAFLDAHAVAVRIRTMYPGLQELRLLALPCVFSRNVCCSAGCEY